MLYYVVRIRRSLCEVVGCGGCDVGLFWCCVC